MWVIWVSPPPQAVVRHGLASLGAQSAPSSAARQGPLLPRALADALQVGATSSASVLMQPRVVFTPCWPFSGHACEREGLASEFCFTPFCPDFSSREV